MKPISRLPLSRGLLFGLVVAATFVAGTACAVDLVPIADAEGDPPGLDFEIDLVVGETDGEADEGVLIASVSRVVEDSRGDLYIAEGRIPCVYRLDAAGALVARYGQAGDGPGDLGFPFTIAIDARDRLYVVRMGGQVSIMNTDWEVIGGFERRNPAGDPRSAAFASDGELAITATNLQNGTTVDRYSVDFAYLDSFSDTFCKRSDWPHRFAASYAGGHLSRGANDEMYYVQYAPYELRRFSATGELLAATREGAAGFVPEPSKPEARGDGFFVAMTSGASGVETLPGGRVATSCWRRDKTDEGEYRTTSRVCLHDAELNLLARSDYEGIAVLCGSDRAGRLFVFRRTDEAQVVLRAALTAGGT